MTKATKLLRHYTLNELQYELSAAETEEAQAYWLRAIEIWWRHQVYKAFAIKLEEK